MYRLSTDDGRAYAFYADDCYGLPYYAGTVAVELGQVVLNTVVGLKDAAALELIERAS